MVKKSKQVGNGIVAKVAAPKSSESTKIKSSGSSGHSKPLAVPASFEDLTRLRVGHLLSILAISHSQLYQRLKEGRLPPCDGHDGKRPYWRASTIRVFLQA